MKNEIILTIGGLILSVLTYFAVVVRTERRNKDQDEEQRISKFIENFNNSRKYGHGRRVIDHLIPSGINNLQSHEEIEAALLRLEEVHGWHPLRDNNEEIKKFGYKDFFSWASKEKDKLTKDTIVEFIKNYKNSLKK